MINLVRVFPTGPVPIGMYALRERRQHVTQEDFEFAVAKVCVRVVSVYSECSAPYRSLRRTRRRTHLLTSCSRSDSRVERSIVVIFLVMCLREPMRLGARSGNIG